MANYNSSHTGAQIDAAITAVRNKESTWDAKANTSDIPTTLAQLTGDSTHRVVTDTQIQNIADNTTNRHSHSNKSLLDGIGSSDISNWNGKQAQHTAISNLSLTGGSSAWASNTQTISVTGVTTTNTVMVSPAPSGVSDWASAGIYCSAQGSGSLTFVCTTVPTNNIALSIVILD